MGHITVTDKRSINIGNYESRTVVLSYSDDIRVINPKTKVVDISETESVPVTDEDFKGAVNKAFERVEARLDFKEKKIREEAIGNEWVDFDEADEKLKAVKKRIKKRKK